MFPETPQRSQLRGQRIAIGSGGKRRARVFFNSVHRIVSECSRRIGHQVRSCPFAAADFCARRTDDSMP